MKPRTDFHDYELEERLETERQRRALEQFNKLYADQRPKMSLKPLMVGLLAGFLTMAAVLLVVYWVINKVLEAFGR